MNKSLLFNTSLIRTLMLNIKYFGIRGIIPKILVSRNVTFRKLKGNVIADNVPIGGVKIGFGNIGIIDRKYEKSIWENTGTILFEGKTFFGVESRIACAGQLTVGENCHFNGGSSIICWKDMRFGSNCLVSWECLFMDTDFHSIFTKDDISTAINPDEAVIIGNHVWVGCRSTILKGATIPDESVVAACSVVTRKLEVPQCVYSGNTIIRENIQW